MHIITFDPTDPVAQARTLRDQYNKGMLSEAEYIATFRALDYSHSQGETCCAVSLTGVRCRYPATVILGGKPYCASHGLAVRRRS